MCRVRGGEGRVRTIVQILKDLQCRGDIREAHCCGGCHGEQEGGEV